MGREEQTKKIKRKGLETTFFSPLFWVQIRSVDCWNKLLKRNEFKMKLGDLDQVALFKKNKTKLLSTLFCILQI